MHDAARLIEQMQNRDVPTWVKSYEENPAALQRAIESMKSPWLDTQNVLRSFSGFARLQGIGQAIQGLPAFDEKLANVLRPELGDWRQVIYVPLIIRKDNWEKIFKPIFRRVEFVQESFQRLYPIRICTMHARIITQDDELYLYVEIKRILSTINPGAAH